jgi:DNA invertase Pin-like site-specific DNA recombinase
MRSFKTPEELERERQEALGLIPFRLPTDKILIIYARQSTKGQVFKNRESALQQTEEQLEWALEMGWPQDLQRLLIENQAKDGTIRNASGRLRIDEREGLSTAMLYINSGEAGAVKVRDVARLFRDEDLVGPVVFAKACKDHRVIVVTDDYTYNFNDPKRGKADYKKFIQEAQEAADFLNKQVAMMARYRKRKGMRGEYAGHNVPTGFMLDDDRLFYVPNPDHAKPLKALFKRFRALGGNLAVLRREIVGQPTFPDLPLEILERTGQIILTKVPRGWTIKSHDGLKTILTNPAYIGHIAYGGRIVKYNAHPAIVDEDDFWFAYYRLAKTDFEGNPIEHPDGVTKRYTQETTDTPYPALLGGLRNDGTPVITTTMGEQASVYINRGKLVTYCALDRSPITTSPHSLRIGVDRLDGIFSERLVYRVGEALKQRASTLAGSEQAAQLEQTYATINHQLDQTLQEAERSQDGQPDPQTALEASIAETKKRIAEKERVGHEASSEMSGEDLRQHYAALKRLRTNLAAMQQKLDRLSTEELEQAEAKQKLPEVHDRWAGMSFESKQRFIRAATSRIVLDDMEVGWARLTIEWSPLLGGDIIDEAYIWTIAGKRWTEEEKQLLREHYATAERSWLLEQLPDRGWDAITVKAGLLGAERSHSVGYWARESTNVGPSLRLSVNDWRFIQEHEIDAEEVLQKRVYWREYVGLPIEANGAEKS